LGDLFHAFTLLEAVFCVHSTGIPFGGIIFEKMPLSGELKLEVIKYLYGNDQSLTKTQRVLMKIYPRELGNLSLKTIQRVVGKLEKGWTLLPVRQTGRPK
jgi:hypothetical protein